MPPLFPPPSFACVEDRIFRSGFPSELNFTFIESLNLKTVVVLSPENVEDQFISFLKDCGIRVVYIHNAANADGFRGMSVVAEETIIEALNVVTKSVNLPALITCRSGKTLTGVVVGCLRKLQRWSFISIFEEYRRFACGGLSQHYSLQNQQHEQFMEMFDTDLVTIDDDSAPDFMKRVRL
jgi:tyrosine-protein phosphatase OCA1